MIAGKKYWIFLIVLLLSGVVSAQTNTASENDLKKKAERFFNSGEYEPAMPVYSQLLSLYPKDPIYNYRYGVCLIKAGKEKVNAIGYLEYASIQTNMEQDVWFYLGRGYMYAGKFQNAKNAFEQLKKNAGQAKAKKFEADLLIGNCTNAEELLKSRRNVAVLSSQEISRTNFYNSYDFSESNGRLLPTAEQFLTGTDKDLQLNPLMFMSKDGQIIYYASYGKNSSGGKDIYLRRKMTNGQWGEPENLGATVNSVENEDYPYLDKDNRTLYFSSRGHNSIGGYDIFKSQFDFNTGKWSEPQNLGIPINTVEDDFLYLPSMKGDLATYVSAMDAGSGKIQLNKIQVGDVSNNYVTISGTYFSLDQVTRRDARVTVLRTSDRGIITSVRTDPRTGKYELVLEPGHEYTLLVEGGSYVPHAETFEIPSMPMANLRQEVKLNKSKEKEEMTLVNFFTPITASSNQGALAVSDVPTETKSKAYDVTNRDTSSLIPVRIDNEVVYVAPPSGKDNVTKTETESPVDISNETISKNTRTSPVTETNVNNPIPASQMAANDLPEDTTEELSSSKKTPKEKYDPYLEKNMTPDELQQKQEEATRTREVTLEEKGKAEEIDVNVSNDELAKLAFDDARSMEMEADSLKKEAQSLRAQATEKDSLSIVLKTESEQSKGKDEEKANALLTQSEDSRSEAEKLVQQASLLEDLSSQREAEARLALQDAKQIVLINEQNKTLANNSSKKNQKSIKGNSQTVNIPVSETGNPNQQEVSATENSGLPQTNEQGKSGDVTTNNQVSTSETKSNISAEQTNSTEEHKSGKIANPVVAEPSGNKATEKNAEKTSGENNIALNESPSNVSGTSSTTNKQNSITSDSPAVSNSPVNSGEKRSETADQSTAQNQISGDTGNKAADQQISENKTETPIQSKGEQADLQTKSAQTEERNNSTLNGQNPATDKNTVVPSNSEVALNTVENVNNQSGKTASTQQPSKPLVKQNQVAGTVKTNQDGSAQQGSIENQGNNAQQNLAANNEPATERNENSNTSPLRTSSVPVNQNESTTSTTGVDFNAIPDVKPEAVIAYKGYEDKMTRSRSLASQSENLQKRVASMKISPVRDSLIEVSNSISRESIQNWQEAQKQLADAKRIDPEIENKVQTYTSTHASTVSASNTARKDHSVSTTSGVQSPEGATSGTGNNSTVDNKQTTARNQNSDSGTLENNNSGQSELAVRSEQKASSSPTNQISGKSTETIPVTAQKQNGTEPSVNNSKAEITNGQTVVSDSKSGENTNQTSKQNSTVSNPAIVAPDNSVSGSDSGINTDENRVVATEQKTPITSTESNTAQNAEVKPASGQKKPAENNSDSESLKNVPASNTVSNNQSVQTVETKNTQTKQSVEQVATENNQKNTTSGQTNANENTTVEKSVPTSGNNSQNVALINTEKNQVPAQATTSNTKSATPASTQPESNKAVKPENTENTTPSQNVLAESKTQQSNESGQPASQQSSVSQPVTNNAAQEKEAGAITERNTSATTSSPVVQEQLDTTKEEYPRYIKIQKDINNAQVETINIFATAINLNKKAVEQKQKQLDLLEKADRTSDQGEKDKLFKEAEKLGKASQKTEALSKQKFTEAQQKTSEVKVLTWQLESVKSKLVIPSATKQATSAQQVTENITNPQQETAANTAAVNTNSDTENKTSGNDAGTTPAMDGSPVAEIQSILAGPAVVLTEEEKTSMAVKVFSRSAAPVYSTLNPIPMNPSLPEGLVFKIQVGAFHKPIPDETFKNLQPVTGENTRPGWIRYCVGMFKTFEPANLVKQDLRKNGFKDAFVVAYFNGKRISLREAYLKLNGEESALRAAYAQQAAREIAMLKTLDIAQEFNVSNLQNLDDDARQFYGSDASKIVSSGGASATEEVLYAVQVGVYRNQNPPAILTTLQPLYTEPLSKGLYRFTNGRYNYFAQADSAKKIAVNTGVKDAFIIVYRNGRRISLAGLGQTASSRSAVSNQPVVRSTTETVVPAANESAVQPGIVFRVQLGAFKNNVPYQMVESFLKISDKGINQETDSRGLHIFYAGTFTEYAPALQLKQEVIEKGVKDAFIVALRNGQRISLSEAFKQIRN